MSTGGSPHAAVIQGANLQAWVHTVCAAGSPAPPPRPKTWSQLPAFQRKPQTQETYQ